MRKALQPHLDLGGGPSGKDRSVYAGRKRRCRVGVDSSRHPAIGGTSPAMSSGRVPVEEAPMRTAIALCLLLTALLAGCAAAPSHARRSSEPTDYFRDEVASTSPPEPSWWDEHPGVKYGLWAAGGLVAVAGLVYAYALAQVLTSWT